MNSDTYNYAEDSFFFFSKFEKRNNQKFKYRRLSFPKLKNDENLQQNFLFSGLALIVSCVFIGGLSYVMYKHPTFFAKSVVTIKNFFFGEKKKKSVKELLVEFEAKLKASGKNLKDIKIGDTLYIMNDTAYIHRQALGSAFIKQAHALEFDVRVAVANFRKKPYLVDKDGELQLNKDTVEALAIAYNNLQKFLKTPTFPFTTIAGLLKFDANIIRNAKAFNNARYMPFEESFLKDDDENKMVQNIFKIVRQELDLEEPLKVPFYISDNLFHQYNEETSIVSAPYSNPSNKHFMKVYNILIKKDSTLTLDYFPQYGWTINANGTPTVDYFPKNGPKKYLHLDWYQENRVNNNVFETFPQYVPSILTFSIYFYNTDISVFILNLGILCVLCVLIVLIRRRVKPRIKEKKLNDKHDETTNTKD